MDAMALNDTMISEHESVPARAGINGARARARDIALAFGGQTVLDGISFELKPGEFVLLQGENGSGKTALFNTLSGYLAPDRGDVNIELNGEWVNPAAASPENLACRGIGRLWQDIRLFPTMTVLDNVLVSTPRLLGRNPVLAILARFEVARQEIFARERALENLATVGIADRANSSCDMLSVGQMKRVALARLLQMEASLLLLDEPLAGLDTSAAELFVHDLARLRDSGRTILVVEHRADALASAADRVWKLSEGRITEVESGNV